MDHCIHISENKIEKEINTFLIKYTRIIQEMNVGFISQFPRLFGAIKSAYNKTNKQK